MDESPNDDHGEAGADEIGSTAEPAPARSRFGSRSRSRAGSGTGRRGRLWSTARLAGRVTGPLLATVVAFTAVTSAAGTDRSAGSGASDLGSVQAIDYREECEGEGCNNEEIRELWDSFQSECFQETCWTEEVFELSGGARYHQEPYHYDTRMVAMFNAFRGRLGKWFQDPKMRMGPTEDFWAWFVELIDGTVVKTPPIACDPYCG